MYLVRVYSIIGGTPINNASFASDGAAVGSTRTYEGYVLPDGFYIVGIGRNLRLTVSAPGFQPFTFLTPDVDEESFTVEVGLAHVIESRPPPPGSSGSPGSGRPVRGWVALTRDHSLQGNPAPFIDAGGRLNVCWVDGRSNRLFHATQSSERGAWTPPVEIRTASGRAVEVSPDFDPVAAEGRDSYHEVHGIGVGRRTHVWVSKRPQRRGGAWSRAEQQTLPATVSATQGGLIVLKTSIAEAFLPTRNAAYWAWGREGHDDESATVFGDFEPVIPRDGPVAIGAMPLRDGVMMFGLGESGVTAPVSSGPRLGEVRVELKTVWHRRREGFGPWQSWQSLGLYGGSRGQDAVPGRPIHVAVRRNADDRPEVFVLTTKRSSRHLHHAWQTAPDTGAWSGWETIETPLPFEPADSGLEALHTADMRTVLFTVGKNGQVWQMRQQAIATGTNPTPPWGPWQHLPAGAELQLTPKVVYCRDGTLALFGAGRDGQLWHIRQPAANADF